MRQFRRGVSYVTWLGCEEFSQGQTVKFTPRIEIPVNLGREEKDPKT